MALAALPFTQRNNQALPNENCFNVPICTITKSCYLLTRQSCWTIVFNPNLLSALPRNYSDLRGIQRMSVWSISRQIYLAVKTTVTDQTQCISVEYIHNVCLEYVLNCHVNLPRSGSTGLKHVDTITAAWTVCGVAANKNM